MFNDCLEITLCVLCYFLKYKSLKIHSETYVFIKRKINEFHLLNSVYNTYSEFANTSHTVNKMNMFPSDNGMFNRFRPVCFFISADVFFEH